jgi:hypothetical protein
MDVGDISISGPDGVEAVLIERKTIPDLLSSIKDGRYREQKLRLSAATDHPNHNIYYLVEGRAETTVWHTLTADDIRTVNSTIFSISHFSGFSTIRTQSIHETVDMLVAIRDKLCRDGGSGRCAYYRRQETTVEEGGEGGGGADATAEGGCGSGRVSGGDNYCAAIRRQKGANITPDNISSIMLQQIPGVSATVAAAVLGKYGGSLFDLTVAVHSDPRAIDGVTFETGKGKRQRVNKTTLAKIVTFLCAQACSPGKDTAAP